MSTPKPSLAPPGSTAQFIEDVVALLAPFVGNHAERESLFGLAFSGRDEPLLRRLEFEGSAEVFMVRAVRLLAERGLIGNEQALSILLGVVRERVGTDQQARIDMLQTVIPFYARLIAAQVARQRVGKQIGVIVLGVVIFGLLLSGVGVITHVVVGQYSASLTPLPTPTTPSLASCEIGIAVGYFALPADNSVSESDANGLLERVYGRLKDELARLNSTVTMCSLGPDVIGVIASQDEAIQKAVKYKARVVLYGTIEQSANGLKLLPQYYSDPHTFAQAYEMGGSYRLGNAVLINDIKSPTIDANRQLTARVHTIAQVFAGLTQYAAEHYTDALASFDSAADWGDSNGTDTLNILRGNTYLRLASVAAQKGDLETAQADLSKSLDAYHLAETNNQNRTSYSYGRVNIALASGSYVQWSLNHQKDPTTDNTLLDTAAVYIDKVQQATDITYQTEVVYQGYFASLQIDFARWRYYSAHYVQPQPDNFKAAFERNAQLIITKAANNSEDSIGYLAAEAHWYLGLEAFGADNRQALTHFEAATDLKLGASLLRRMFFWDSVGETHETLNRHADALMAYQEALKLAITLNQSGTMQRYIDRYQLLIDGKAATLPISSPPPIKPTSNTDNSIANG